MLKYRCFYRSTAASTPRLGLKLAHPDLGQGVGDYVGRNGDEFAAPALLALRRRHLLGLAAAARARRRALLCVAVLAGVLAYPALLFIAGPAAARATSPLQRHGAAAGRDQRRPPAGAGSARR